VGRGLQAERTFYQGKQTGGSRQKGANPTAFLRENAKKKYGGTQKGRHVSKPVVLKGMVMRRSAEPRSLAQGYNGIPNWADGKRKGKKPEEARKRRKRGQFRKACCTY